MEGGVYVNGVLFDKEGYLIEEILRVFKFGNLKDEDLIFILDYISDC